MSDIDPHSDDPIDLRARAAMDALVGSVDGLDVEAGLAAARQGSGAPMHEPPHRRRWFAAVAAAAVVIGGTAALVVVANQEDAGVLPADTVASTIGTTPESTRSTTANSTTTVSTTTTSTTTTTTVAASITSAPPIDVATLLNGVAWEDAGIDRSCRPGTGLCTRVVHDPSGIPVSYDPVARTLTRHGRDGGEFVSARLPGTFSADAYLVAAGPDHVVYLNDVRQQGAEGAADLVAVALAPGDAGREIERATNRGNPGYDADFVATPAGIVTTGWYGEGQRPSSDRAVVMSWVDRDPTDGDDPGAAVDSITIDAYERLATVDGRTWEVTGQAAELAPPGMPPIVRTFDGGFIAVYSDTFHSPATFVVRGWPDGSVEEWAVPLPPDGWVDVIPEPMGTVLVGGNDSFARAAPFDPVPARWGGSLTPDVESGEVDATELNADLSSLDWTLDQSPWDIDAVAFASAVVGAPSSPEVLQTVDLADGPNGTFVVTVTNERFFDDSVYGERWVLTINSDLRSVSSITWTNSCQPGRGHQDYQAAFCV